MRTSKPASRGSLTGVHVQLLDFGDVIPVHLLAGAHERERARDLGGATGRHATVVAAGIGAPVPDLDGRERALLVDHVAHEAQVPDVTIVPEPCADTVCVVALGSDPAVLGRNRPPTALGFHRTKVRLEARPVRARSIAVSHLEEPVWKRLWAHLDGLEKDVVFWISRHLAYLSSSLPDVAFS